MERKSDCFSQRGICGGIATFLPAGEFAVRTGDGYLGPHNGMVPFIVRVSRTNRPRHRSYDDLFLVGVFRKDDVVELGWTCDHRDRRAFGAKVIRPAGVHIGTDLTLC